jgi:hypothetical protein
LAVVVVNMWAIVFIKIDSVLCFARVLFAFAQKCACHDDTSKCSYWLFMGGML